MLPLALFSTLALAESPEGDPLPSHLGSPTAVNLDAGSGAIEAGMTAFLWPFSTAGGTHVGGAAAITDRLAVYGDGYAFKDAGEVFSGVPIAGGGSLGARFSVLRSKGFSMAPWVAAELGNADGSQAIDFVSPAPLPFVEGFHVMGGVAFELGSRHARFDLTLPLVTWELERGTERSGAWTAARVEGGLTVLLDEQRRHALRIGMVSLVPVLSYRYQSKGAIYAEGLVGPLVLGGKVGARF